MCLRLLPILAITAAACSFGPRPLLTPEPGVRVRVTHECPDESGGGCARDEGTIASIATDTLTVVGGDRVPIAIARTSLRRIEASPGQHIKVVRAAGFAALGWLGGAVLGNRIVTLTNPGEDIMTFVGGVIGSGIELLGGLIYGLIPVDTWHEAPFGWWAVRRGVNPVTRRVGLGMNLRF